MKKKKVSKLKEKKKEWWENLQDAVFLNGGKLSYSTKIKEIFSLRYYLHKLCNNGEPPAILFVSQWEYLKLMQEIKETERFYDNNTKMMMFHESRIMPVGAIYLKTKLD